MNCEIKTSNNAVSFITNAAKRRRLLSKYKIGLIKFTQNKDRKHLLCIKG